jgi:hypothetical protein
VRVLAEEHNRLLISKQLEKEDSPKVKHFLKIKKVLGKNPSAQAPA